MANQFEQQDDKVQKYGFKKLAYSKETLFEYRPLVPIKTEEDYQASMDNLDILMNLARDHEKEFNRLTRDGAYLAELAKFIEEYESNAAPQDDEVTGLEMLKFLMEQNSLTQKSLSDMLFGGHQGNLSQILKGKRELTVDHIRKLSKHFKISPAAFI